MCFVVFFPFSLELVPYIFFLSSATYPLENCSMGLVKGTTAHQFLFIPTFGISIIFVWGRGQLGGGNGMGTGAGVESVMIAYSSGRH